MVVDRDQVVPVAARLGVGAAGQVARRGGEAGHPRQLAGEQAALQDVGDLVLDGVQPGAVQRLRALPGDGQDDRALARPHPLPVRREGQPDRADRPALEQERDDGVGRQPVDRARAARPGGEPGAHRAGQRVLPVEPDPSGGPRQHLELFALAQHDHRLGRAERQRVPGDHGGHLGRSRRPRERRHDVGQALRRAPGQRLRGEQARPLQRVGALVGERERDRAVVGGQIHGGQPDRDGPDPVAADHQRQRQQARVAGVRELGVGLGVAAHPLLRGPQPARAAVARGVGERGPGRYRDARPRRLHRGTPTRAVQEQQGVVAAPPHPDRAGAEQLAELVDRRPRDRPRARRGGERRGGPLQQLQPTGGGLLRGQQRRVVQRRRGPLADLAQQRGVVLLQWRRARRAGRGQEPDHPAAGAQRHDDHRAHPQRPPRSTLFLVGRAEREVAVVDGDELDTAGQAVVEAPRRVELAHDLLVRGAGRRHRDRLRPALGDVDEPGHVDQALGHERPDEHVAAPRLGGLGVHRGADGVEQPPAFAFALPVVDVEAAADVGARVADGSAPVQHPAVPAVRAPEPVLQLERLPGRHRGRPDRGAALDVLGVDARPPALTEVVRGARAGELPPGPVDQGAACFGVVDPDQRGRGVGERLELGLDITGRQPSHSRPVPYALCRARKV